MPKSKCATCAHHSCKQKDIVIRPTSSSCTWKTMDVHSCSKGVYMDKEYMPSKSRCVDYKDKNKNPKPN